MRKIFILLFAIVFTAGTAGSEEAAPTFHYNNQRTGATENAGPKSPQIVWQFQADASLSASPVIAADGTIYLAATDGKLYALMPDGAMMWIFQASDSIFGTPAIAPDGAILFGDLAGKYYAVGGDGKLKWSLSFTGTERRIVSSPVIDSDGQSYIASWNEQFYAIRSDGTTRWKAALEGLISSSPALDEDGNAYLAANDPDSRNVKLGVMKFMPNSSSRVWTLSEDLQSSPARIISSPAIDSVRQQLYVGACLSSNGALFAVNLSTGNRTFRTLLPKGTISSPAIGKDGTVYIGCLDGGLYAVDPENGAKKWTFQTSGAYVFSSPSVDGNGTIYIGDSDGVLFALSPAGNELWRFATKSNIASSPVVAKDGTLYITSYDSTLYAIGNPTAVMDWSQYFNE
ncbi:MAG: PQQ-binding-like beta-propeller repeat protein [Candidatus Omnitrophota bacterium]